MCAASEKMPSLTSMDSKCVLENVCLMCSLLGYLILVGSSLYQQHLTCWLLFDGLHPDSQFHLCSGKTRVTRISMKQQRTDRFKKSCIKEARQVAELGNRRKMTKQEGVF